MHVVIRGLRSLRWAWLPALSALPGGCAAADGDTGWLKLSTAEFVVITPLRQKDAVVWAGEFAQYVAALRSFFKAEHNRPPPLTFVVFARERDFAGFRPLGADGKPQAMAGFFLRRESWSVAGTGGTRLDEQMRHSIFHEGAHWFMSTSPVPTPVWLEEGLAEMFSTFEISDGQAAWGKFMESHIRLLRQEGLMPLERLLFTGREELFGRDTTHTGKVYAQSWAFAHYLVFGTHAFPVTALADYGSLLRNGQGPDEAFRRAFGKTYREMDDDLKRYIGGDAFHYSRVPLVGFAPPRVEPAGRVDIEDALARLALAARRWELAATHARGAIAAGADDPRGHEVLALALTELGQTKEANAEFTRAEKLGSTDAQIPFGLAVAEQNEGADATGAMFSPGPQAARRAADRYLRAIALYPRFQVAYQNLAGLAEVVEPLRAEDRDVLESGRKLWPDDASIEVGLAILSRRAGDRPASRARLERVLASTASDGAGARAFARRVAEGWELQDMFDEIARLHTAERFAEAMALIEKHLADGVPAYVRVQLVGMQSTLADSITAKKIEQALRDQQWREARRLVTAVIDGDSSVALKNNVGRILADLDRKGLGNESTEK